MTNILRIIAFVTIIIPSTNILFGLENTAKPAYFRFFTAVGSAVQTTKVGDAPALPQLRRSAEAGFSFIPNETLRASLSIGAFLVDPAIPAGKILYRGYSGFSIKSALDFSFIDAAERETHPIVSVGGGACLARYEQTNLAFLAFTASIAPGIAHNRAGLYLRVSMPLELEFRGDATAFSIGLLFSLNRTRISAQRKAE